MADAMPYVCRIGVVMARYEYEAVLHGHRRSQNEADYGLACSTGLARGARGSCQGMPSGTNLA